MRHLTVLSLLACTMLMIASCNNKTMIPLSLQARLDSMEQKLKHSYAPGMGELMLNIQVHHAKLWFAGKNGNWELVAYNESLIRSAFQKIKVYHSDNPATAAAAMIDVPMDSISAAGARKDKGAFQRSFGYLTATCNNCHVITKHPFNLIKIPTVEPIGNQSFSLNLR